MIRPRWRKVMADLWANKTRTALVVLTIAVGVFALGTVSGLYAVLLNDMDADYRSSNPASATLSIGPFADDLLESVRRVPGVAEAEGRGALGGRIEGQPGEWYAVNIISIPPLDEIQIFRLRPDDPALSVGPKEVVLERSGLGLLPARPGDTVQIELRDGTRRRLRMAGTVQDLAELPSTITRQVRAFVSPETMEWLGGPPGYNQLYLTVAEPRDDEAHVNAVARAVADKMEKDGRTVTTFVPPWLDQHPANQLIIQPMLVFLGVLGLMSVGLSGFLVVNTIASLLAQHVRQIGVMKAIGARTGQIVGMYVVLLLGFGLLALAIAVPLSGLAISVLAQGFAEFFNFNLSHLRYPSESLALQAMVAVFAPVLAALGPVLSGTRLTVREAISNYGLGQGAFGKGWIDGALERVRFLSRPLLISLRNTFRRKARLALTLLTLTLAGSIFIAILSVRGSMAAGINETLGYILADVNLSLNLPYRAAKIEQIALSIPGVTRVEAWGAAGGQLLSADRATSLDVVILAPPADSTLIRPVMLEGRWVSPEDENAIVIGPQLVQRRPDIQVGDELVIKVRGQEHIWRVVGIYKILGNVEPPLLYGTNAHLSKVTGEIGRGQSFRIATDPHDDATQERVAQQLEDLLRMEGVQTQEIQTGSFVRNVNSAFTDYIVWFGLMMSILSAAVGGLGLMSTMSMNVMERTREIGVMRAIGASDGAVLRLVIVEGLAIGGVSWALAVLLGIPFALLFENAIGYAFMRGPLPFTFSVAACLIWLSIVVVISALASVLPAWNASRLTVRDVLAYE